MNLECPNCGTPPEEMLEGVSTLPSEYLDTHGEEVACNCGTTYEIHYRACKIVYQPENDSPSETIRL